MEELQLADRIKVEFRGTTADILAERLKEMILSGEIKPGYTFPSESIFCEQLTVGRSTLREAYKSLETMGFITRRKGQGTVVNDYSTISISVPFGTSIKLSEAVDIMDFREMIEGELARLAAKRATEEQIDALSDSLSNMKKNRCNIAELTKYDTRFHMGIAAASHNQLMINMMQSIEETFNKFIYEAFHVDSAANTEEAIDFHCKILDAIKSHDSALAQKLMRAHVRSIRKRLGIK